MDMWVIYDRPKDFLDQYVVRQWFIGPGVIFADEQAYLAATLEAARAMIPTGLTPIPRKPDDDPVIVEVWI